MSLNLIPDLQNLVLITNVADQHCRTECGAPEHPGGVESGASAAPHQEEAVQAPGQDDPPARRETPGASFIITAHVLK